MRDPYFGLWNVFRATIKGTVRKRRLRREVRTWLDLVEEVSCPYYDITLAQHNEQASAARWADKITQPVLCLHADSGLQDLAFDETDLCGFLFQGQRKVNPLGDNLDFHRVEMAFFNGIAEFLGQHFGGGGGGREEGGGGAGPAGGPARCCCVSFSNHCFYLDACPAPK